MQPAWSNRLFTSTSNEVNGGEANHLHDHMTAAVSCAPSPVSPGQAPRRWPGRLAAVTALTLALSACGLNNDGYTYVTNQKERAFFKVPDGWKQFRIKAASSTDRPTAISRGIPWQVVFDGSSKPKVANFDLSHPSKPVGMAEVVTLGSQGQEQMNDVMLRSWALDGITDGTVDPIDLWRNGSERVEIVSYSRFANKGGVWGSKIIMNVKMDTGDGSTLEWVTIAQKAYVDRANSKVFRLRLKCNASCYKTDRRQLDQVLDSLAVRP